MKTILQVFFREKKKVQRNSPVGGLGSGSGLGSGMGSVWLKHVPMRLSHLLPVGQAPLPMAAAMWRPAAAVFPSAKLVFMTQTEKTKDVAVIHRGG